MTIWDTIATLFPDNAGAAATGGLLGGFVRMLTLGGSVQGFITAMLVGSITAIYLGPVAAEIIQSIPYIGKLEKGIEPVGHFGAGVIGISMIATIVEFARFKRSSAGVGDDEA